MEKACKEYIENCPDSRIVTVTEKGDVIKVPHPTITGLAIHLGYESRQSCYDLEKSSTFSYIIKKYRMYIEKNYENLLLDKTAGAIFALKNMGWSDKQEINQTGEMDNNINISFK